MPTTHYAKLLVFAILLCLGCGSGRQAVEEELSYAKLVRNAETEEAAGNYAAAADYYARAYRRRPKNTDLLYRAAEYFSRIKDYQRAADAFAPLEFMEEKYPLVGLYYGRELKQDGQYQAARRTLQRFLESYNGADRPIVAELTRNALAGIELATGPEASTSRRLGHPGRGINTVAQEYGPVAVATDQMLFSSNAGGQARIYESKLLGGKWTKAAVPPGFPVIAEGAYGTGTLGRDGMRFYFTICSGPTGFDQDSRCEIFRGRRSTSGIWSRPERLGNQVNAAGFNNAYPAVAVVGDEEWLFFSSNRSGGRGGMDLYLTRRPLADPGAPFGMPQNLGPVVNTVGNEISPFLDANGKLYFASDGHPGFGGLDLFVSEGLAGNWQRPRNLLRPINSSADDYGYSSIPTDGTVAFFASNRLFGNDKQSTTDADIFSVKLQSAVPQLRATAFDNASGDPLPGVTVTVYDLTDGGERLVQRETFPDATYGFDLEPNRRYRVNVGREGYTPVDYQLITLNSSELPYGQPVFLRRSATPPPPPPPSEPVTLTQSDLPVGQAGADQPTTPDPQVVPAVAYRIQISAERRFDPDAVRFRPVASLGSLESEPIPGRNLRRITVGFFTDPAEAKRQLEWVRGQGFADAFVVRYDAGVRHGRVNL